MAEGAAPPQNRKAVTIASFGGWAIDAFDYQLFGLALPLLLVSWKLSPRDAGSIIAIALVCASVGGPLGGLLADRIGRLRVLTISILVFTIATFCAAFVTAPWQLMVLKGVQGVGFGAEWSVGAVMLAEIAPARRRGLFLGVMQSAWALGRAVAVLVYLAATLWLPGDLAWRIMFLMGIVPACFVFWLRRRLPEDRHARSVRATRPLPMLDRWSLPRRLILASLIGLGAHGGFHSLFTWLPTLLRTVRLYPPEFTGLVLLIMTAAFAAGCIVAGYLADNLGRKPVIALFAGSSALFALLFSLTDNGPIATLLLALPLGFAAGGTPAVLGSWFAEMFPVTIRGASVGLAYNGGRLASAILPGVIGWASVMLPLDRLIGMVAAASYGLVMLILPFLPQNARRKPDRRAIHMMLRRTFLQSAVALAASPSVSPSFGASRKEFPTIDTHAHVFRRDLPVAERRRYTVDYNATPHDYLIMLRGNGMRNGVLIQPSFLGFDNSYLLSVLARHTGQLRGIVALSHETPAGEMARLAKVGVCGIRLNLIGRANPDLYSKAWRNHLEAVAALGWQVELQCEAARLPDLVPALLRAGTPVVIDHFGRPDPALGIDDPGFRYLLNSASRGHIYVKLSAPYRIGEALADSAAPILLRAFGPERLLWGSDWPHTQFEKTADARQCRRALDHWVPDVAARSAILSSTPARLFGFDALKVR